MYNYKSFKKETRRSIQWKQDVRESKIKIRMRSWASSQVYLVTQLHPDKQEIINNKNSHKQ